MVAATLSQMATRDVTEGVVDGDRETILTPDQRVRVFVSSTMEELAIERVAVRDAVERMRLSPVLFELGARAHPPQSLYRSYLEQSHVFVGIYWERYGWIAPSMDVSGLEDEYLLAGTKPKLMYVKRPAPGRESRLDELLDRIRSDDDVAYKPFADADELEALVTDDLSLLLSEAFLVVPGSAAARRPRFTLPADVTGFVGRDDELAMLGGLLTRDDVRLVTLTGPGGIGKTRLALRAASESSAAFDEGAAFVSLASVQEAGAVVNAIAATIGIRDNSGPSVDLLRADLATRSLLLVLDNFEHVMGAAGIVSELLDAAPGLRILVTSREALHLRSEWEVPVSSLSREDSARLFEERAMAVRPGFLIDGSNHDAVDRVCRRLEGVPLAIELAAARSKLLTPDSLLERLDHRLDFLVGGARDLPERQQALRHAIAWSHDLLDEPERHLFRDLGVFVGSFSLSAVAAVAGDAAADDRDLLDLLASLVDKSLLRVEASAGEPRFRMLEMIAEFARDRLAESDDAVADRHARFYLELSVQIGAGVTGGEQRRWLSVLGGDEDGEAGNIRAALAWLLDHRRLDELAVMAWSLWVPAWINGRVEEGRQMAGAALGVGGDLSEGSRSRLLVVLGTFQMWAGDHIAATESLRLGRDLAVELDDETVLAAATLAQSMIAGPVGGEAQSEHLAEEALERYERLNDRWGRAAALNALGWLFVSQERVDRLADVAERTLEASLAAGDEQFSAMAEVNLAEYLLHQGDVDACRALLSSCVDRHRALRLLYSVAYLLEACARLAATENDPARASRLLGAASQLRESTGVSVWGSQLERRGGSSPTCAPLSVRTPSRSRSPVEPACPTSRRWTLPSGSTWRRAERRGLMDEPYRVDGDVHVLPSQMDVPGVGSIPINAFVILSDQPVLVDCGLGNDEPDFIEALGGVIDPAELAWIWLTHDDADHTGSLRTLLQLAPRARLATHGLGALRMNTAWPVPLDRVHAIVDGDRLDVGDRILRALRPPTYDNPMSTGIFDEASATLFSVDSFGAILQRSYQDVSEVAEEELLAGMVAWATFDSPWLHLAGPERVAHALEDVRALGAEQVLSSHLPPAVGRVDALIDVVAGVPDAAPFVAPDAATFDLIASSMRSAAGDDDPAR